MRVLIIALALLLLQSVALDKAFACRGPFLSTHDIVKVSSNIFSAKVAKRISASENEDIFELEVIEVLKGTSLHRLIVNGNALIHPNDNCLAIESGQPFPHVQTGEEWLVSGNFDTNQNFVPTNRGSFRLAFPDDRAIEGRNSLLNEFRKAISHMDKKPRNVG